MNPDHGSRDRGRGNVYAAVGHVRHSDWKGEAVVHLYRDCYHINQEHVNGVVKLKAAFLPDCVSGCGSCRNRLARQTGNQQLATDGGSQ